MLIIYRLAINIVIFFSPIIILIRILKKKEDLTRWREKFSIFTKKRTKGKLIWFHGASVGEILSVIPLIKKLENNNKIKQILITSNTVTSANVLNKIKLKKTIHQFFPIDTNYHSKKFLNYWKPSIAIFIDSEIWPNMFLNIKKAKITLALLNGRITKKTFTRWKKIISSAKYLFGKFDICLSASIKSKKYLKSLGAKNIKYIGNLKFTQIEKEEIHLTDELKKKISLKKVWCASSTHKGEEILCAKVHKKLKAKHKNLLTIMIPRHVERTKDILKDLSKLKLNVHLHSSKQKINSNTDIYLVDAYGMTKSFFKICNTIFLGGSIIEHGGQNPIEPSRYGCKVLHGKNIWNFSEIYSLLKKNNVSIKVNNVNQMCKEINSIFSQKLNVNHIKSKIDTLGNKILHSTLSEINYYINKK